MTAKLMGQRLLGESGNRYRVAACLPQTYVLQALTSAGTERQPVEIERAGKSIPALFEKQTRMY